MIGEPHMRISPLFCVLGLAAAVGACRPSGRTAAVPPPVASPAPAALPRPSSAIDALLRAEWERGRIAPAPRVDDLGFLRRASLDIIGRIPTLAEIDAFARDRAEERRARVVDRLLASKEYAEHWANYWDGVLLGDDVRGKVIDEPGFRQWLSAKFEKDTPWDRVVFDLVTASGVNRGPDPDDAAAEPPAPEAKMDMAEALPMERGPRSGDDAINPAVNWLLKYKDTPQDLAGNVSSTFLGVRIQCAQCHDHKTEKWTQNDFRRLAACFMRTRSFSVEPGKSDGPKRLAVQDVSKTPGKLTKNPDLEPLTRAAPAALDGTDLSQDPNRREALARWITSPKNPWFAKAIVNRLWGEFLGRGFVEPIDDFRTSNPALAPEVLDRLGQDFVADSYDLKSLIRTIAATEAYQLSSRPEAGSSEPGALWSRFALKPLGPDELLDSVAVATDLDEMLAAKKDGDFAKAKAQLRKEFNFLFDVDEESHPAGFEGTIPQALMLMNGRPVVRVTNTARHGALLKILSMPEDDDHKLETLFLRTLSRRPTPAENAQLVAFVAETGGQKLERFEDLMWALLNSSEFVFNH
jgi:hypothetical protein